MATIVCANCKAELSEYKRFCPECGARLPEPEAPAVAPTVILPPVDAPAPPPAVPPTVRLDLPQARPEDPPPTVMLPPASGATPPSPVGALPPIGELPPAGEQPMAPAGGLNLPPAGAAEAPPAAPRRKMVWWIVGGVGCLSLLLLGVCGVGFLTLLGNRVGDATPVPGSTAVTGGGGIVPDDSPLTGGSVLLEDDFDNPLLSGLGEDEDETSRYAYEGGAYVMQVKETQTLVWARFDGSYSGAQIAVDAEVPPGSEIIAAGLVFHYQDADNFYLFSVSNDGYYALEVLEGNEWTTLIDWTQSDAVDAVRNRLGVATEGDRIALYVNDELLEETVDGTFVEGEVGIAVSSLESPTAEIHFDNMLITEGE